MTVLTVAYGLAPGGCSHGSVSWTSTPQGMWTGAKCDSCGTWWRLDLIPPDVAARLTGGSPPRENARPFVAGRRPS